MIEDRMKLVERIREVLPSATIGRYDLLPIFMNPELFKDIVQYLAEPYRDKVDYVVAPEAIGWILGSAIAIELGVGFIPIRKKGKLPYKDEDLITTEFMDYTRKTKAFQVSADSMDIKGHILIVDEWVETGSQMKSLLSLFNACDIKGIVTIGIDINDNTRDWIDNDFVTYIGMDI